MKRYNLENIQAQDAIVDFDDPFDKDLYVKLYKQALRTLEYYKQFEEVLTPEEILRRRKMTQVIYNLEYGFHSYGKFKA